MDLLILSPCFYASLQEARLMLESAHAQKLPVMTYGVGEQFIPHGADAQVEKLWQLMQRQQLAEYALITDCRDVLFLANQEEIIRKFHEFDSKIVMSTENGCWPPDAQVVEYFYGKSAYGYDFINAGQYIGTWGAIVDALDYLLKNYRNRTDLDNSQGWWASALMRGELQFALDRNCYIFQTMSGGADAQVELQDGRFVNVATGSTPCSLHFNGNPGKGEPHREAWNLLKQRN